MIVCIRETVPADIFTRSGNVATSQPSSQGKSDSRNKRGNNQQNETSMLYGKEEGRKNG